MPAKELDHFLAGSSADSPMTAGGSVAPDRLALFERWHHTSLAPAAKSLCVLFEKRCNLVESEIGHKHEFDTHGFGMEAKCTTAPHNENNALPVRDNETPAPGLTDARGLAEALCPDPRSRPCLRTVRRWQEMRLIPFLKIGKKVMFDPVQVRRALDARFTIRAK